MKELFDTIGLLGPVIRAVAFALQGGSPVIAALEAGAVALAVVIEARRKAEVADANADAVAKFPELEIK